MFCASAQEGWVRPRVFTLLPLGWELLELSTLIWWTRPISSAKSCTPKPRSAGPKSTAPSKRSPGSIRASAWTTFYRLHVPSALPSILDGCKSALPLAVIGAIVGEFVGSEHGLGHLILEANANARTDLLFAALIAVSVLAGVLYLAVELAAKRVWWRAL